MKFMLLAAAALSSSLIALPALADVAATADAPAAAPSGAPAGAPGARPEHPHGPRGEMKGEMGQMREGFKADREKEHTEHKAEDDAARADFRKRMEAAKTPEEREAILNEGRAKIDAMRKQRFDDNTKMIDAHRAEMDKKAAELRAKAAADKSTGAAPAAK